MNETVTPFPAGACDTHIHFYDARHAAAPGSILRPPDASVSQYRSVQRELGLDRVVVVQPTTYGTDNRFQLEAMEAFGDAARGIMVVGAAVTRHELDHLTALGARGARFHMLPGGALGWEELPAVAGRIADHGWHIQLQLNGRELAQRLRELGSLPTPLVVDHVGRYMPPVAIDHPAFAALVGLLDAGACWVKLSAPYESSVAGPPGYDDVAPLVAELVRRAPERMLWATNWPHPGRTAPSPAALAALFARWVPDPATRKRILVDNPTELYGFAPVLPGVETGEERFP